MGLQPNAGWLAFLPTRLGPRVERIRSGGPTRAAYRADGRLTSVDLHGPLL